MALTSIPRVAVLWVQLELQEGSIERDVEEILRAINEGFRVELKPNRKADKSLHMAFLYRHMAVLFASTHRPPLHTVMKFLKDYIRLDNNTELIQWP